MKLRTKLVLVTVLLSLLLSAPVNADAAANDIGEKLICQCGCTLVLVHCTHSECHSKKSMTATIVQKLDAGESPTQIIQSFVDQYGEQVLAAPPKRGFNLTAWILPFGAIIVGGGAIYAALLAWRRHGKEGEIEEPVVAGLDDPEYETRLSRDLAQFDEETLR